MIENAGAPIYMAEWLEHPPARQHYDACAWVRIPVSLGKNLSKNNLTNQVKFELSTLRHYLSLSLSIYIYIYIYIYIILPYAFKMRRDYLSTSYLDQKYLPSERSDTREI